MLAAILGDAVYSNFESPGTSSKGGAMLRGGPFAAEAYRERMRSAGADGAGGEPPPARDLTKEVPGRVLEGERLLLVTANSAPEIPQAPAASRVRLRPRARQRGRGVLLEEIRAAGVAILVSSAGEPRAHRVVETAAQLAEAGIPFAIRTGSEGRAHDACCCGRARSPPPTGSAARGRSTQGAAGILGVDDRIGSLDRGRQACRSRPLRRRPL